jgi:hypothetical protein
MRYILEDFSNILFNGFEIKLPDETLNIISEIAQHVGSPSYIKTPIFNKRDPLTNMAGKSNHHSTNGDVYKKKKKNKNTENISDEDWETLRNFQATKMEQKVGIDSKIVIIRSLINKITDKTYVDLSDKMIEVLDELLQDGTNEEEMMKVGNSIFDIASNNRFYSKIYADLYAKLINRYEIIKIVFEKSFNTFLELFENIQHINPEEDYNKFIQINSENEKRKSLSSFFVNLMLNGIITKEKIIELTCRLLSEVLKLIKEENKKSVVDEITENISLLYNKDIFEKVRVNDELFVDIINKLSLCKVKTYPSLSNKSIFKYMDLNEL